MFDVAVIGGGPAGLTAALALVRSRKHVVLYDAWPPRNAAATEVRGFVTQDGTPPHEMRRLAREQLASYPTFVAYDDAPVRAIRGARGDFAIESAAVPVAARRIVLAAGLVDVLPDIPGYRELWGTSIFQCPNCHGWEVRDQRFAYLAPDASCAGWALLLRAWTEDLIVFTGGAFELPPDLAADLATARVTVEHRPVTGFEERDGKLAALRLADGTAIERDIVFARPPQRQTDLVLGLGVALDRRDIVHTSETFETSVPGIYAAGDLMTSTHGALVAAANGARAAHALDEELTRDLVLGRA